VALSVRIDISRGTDAAGRNTIHIETDDGTGVSFVGGLKELKEWVRAGLDEDDKQKMRELAIRLALARWLKQNPNPTLADIAKVSGKTITIDLLSAVSVQ
jgi:hypothetical protein